MKPMRWWRWEAAVLDALTAGGALVFGCALLWAGDLPFATGIDDPARLLPALALASGALVLRRTRPLLGLGLAAAAAVADVAAGPSLLPVPIVAHLLYNATLYGPAHRVPWLIGGGYAVSGAAALAVLAHTRSLGTGLLTAVCGSLALAWPALTVWTVRRHRERAEQAQRRIKVERQRSAMQERVRMAGDIHDVVGNHLSALVLQSAAAMATAPRDNEKHLTALVEIRRSSLAGMNELRRMVAALRTEEQGPEQGPEPAPASLDLARVLVERMKGLGSRARLRTVGTPVALPQEVETAACRIIQEALTNVLKYAHGAAVDTTIAYRRDQVVITVENDLSAANPDLVLVSSGFGLVSMVERAARVGGTCTAGQVGNRWRVHAVIPLPSAAGGRSEHSLTEESLHDHPCSRRR